jgi:hypothetical protein
MREEERRPRSTIIGLRGKSKLSRNPQNSVDWLSTVARWDRRLLIVKYRNVGSKGGNDNILWNTGLSKRVFDDQGSFTST